jgi:hypothetical protein
VRQQNRGNKQDAGRKKSSFHERLCPKRESDVRPQSALFSNSMLDNVKSVLHRHAAAKATAQQARELSTATAGVNYPSEPAAQLFSVAVSTFASQCSRSKNLSTLRQEAMHVAKRKRGVGQLPDAALIEKWLACCSSNVGNSQSQR